MVSGDCPVKRQGCPGEMCLGSAVRDPCAGDGYGKHESLWAHAHVALYMHRGFADGHLRLRIGHAVRVDRPPDVQLRLRLV